MRATILDLRRRMPAILGALDRHERVTILYRGKERAVLIPTGDTAAGRDRGALRQHPAFGMWSDQKDPSDVPAQVRALRRGRGHAL